MWKFVFAISLAAALAVLLRWLLGLKLTALLPTFPPGTLPTHLTGGYVIGLGLVFFSALPSLPPEWRPLVITGFCGGLTAFSIFSAEIATLIQQGRPSWAMASVGVHVLGSALMTLAGIATVAWARSRP